MGSQNIFHGVFKRFLILWKKSSVSSSVQTYPAMLSEAPYIMFGEVEKWEKEFPLHFMRGTDVLVLGLRLGKI